MTSYCRAPVTYTAHQRAIVGDTKMTVIRNDHLGWMLCDGRTLNVNDYYLLWRVIGYSFGSNDANTFYLPNAAGRVPGVVGTGRDANTQYSTLTVALGDMVGEYAHRLTIDEMPAHRHGPTDLSGASSGSNGSGYTTSNGQHAHDYTTYSNADRGYVAATDNDGILANTQTLATSSNGEHNHYIGSTGGSNWHNNVQPLIGLGNMFIFSGKYMAPSDAAVPFAGYPYLSNSQIL
jgi:microcystin-dependent protein